MHRTSWISHAIAAFFIPFTLAVPKPHTDVVQLHNDPANIRLDNGVIAFIRPYPSGGNWQLDYDDLADTVDEITGGAASGITAKIKAAFGIETNSKVASDNGGQKAATPATSHGTFTGRVYTYPANEGSEYLCSIQIGGQTLQINLDTGSSDFWIFSTALESHEQGSHTLYDPSRSQSHEDAPNALFNASYGDDTFLTGYVAKDTVTVANIPAFDQTIALPTSFSDGIIDDPSDGILGLGFQSLNSICSNRGSSGGPISSRCPEGYVRDPQPTWFETARSSLQSGVFAVNFKFGTKGYYDFGSYDTSAFKGQLNYVPINNAKGYWQFQSRSYRVGGTGQAVGFDGRDGIADSGTSLLKLDDTVVQAYYAKVKGAQNDESGWVFPCDADLPDLDIALGNYLATVEGKAINYAETKTKNCRS